MDKAIEYLESRRLFLSAIDDSILNSNQQNMKICELKLLCESLSQLWEHKAKIDELKEWATETYNYFDKIIDDATGKTDFEEGAKMICKDILQKLEELQKST